MTATPPPPYFFPPAPPLISPPPPYAPPQYDGSSPRAPLTPPPTYSQSQRGNSQIGNENEQPRIILQDSQSLSENEMARDYRSRDYRLWELPAQDQNQNQSQNQNQIQIQNQIQNQIQIHLYHKTTSSGCCCRLKTWTKVIATIHSSFSAGILIWIFFEVFERSTYGIRTGVPWPAVLFGFIGLVLGCYLFAGARYGKPGMILIWMIPIGMGLAFYAVILFCILIFDNRWISRFDYIVPLAILLVLTVAFSVVSKHRRDLLEMRNEHWRQRLQQI